MVAGCNVDNLEISQENGRILTADAEIAQESQTKGYWHYMDGGSIPFLWTGDETLSTSIFSKTGGDWMIIRGGVGKTIDVGITPDNSDRRFARMNGTIISSTEILSGDFIYFTNGEVNQENPGIAEFTLPDFFTQKANTEESLSEYMFVYGQSSIISADASSVSAGKVSFRHVPSTFRFNITNHSGKSLKISSLKITITDGNGVQKAVFPKSVIMDIDPEDADNAFTFNVKEEAGRYSEIILDMTGSEGANYFILPNGSSYDASILAMPAEFNGETMTVSAMYHGEEEYTELKTVTLKSLEMKAGHIYVMDIEVTRPSADPANMIDLSAEGTANTYIVNQAMTFYSFDASVKGNGVPRSFYATELEQNLRIEPKSALVLWYNCLQTDANWKDECPIIIESIEITDGKICFETPEDFVDGNVIIAAFAEEGVTYDSIAADEDGIISNATIIWSWNIWAVKDYVLDDNAIQAGNCIIMDRNLGALRNCVPDGDENLKKFIAPSTIGNYYQWGRKDPFPHHADSRNYYPFYLSLLACTPTYTPVKALQHTLTDRDGTTLLNQIFSNEGVTNMSSNATKIAYKIDAQDKDYVTCVTRATGNPHKFITDGETFPNWVPNDRDSYTTFALWGDPEYGEEDDIEKTIYDPCPAGWRLWTNHTFLELIKVSETIKPYRVSDIGVNLAGSYFAVNGGGRKANGNQLFSLGWVIQPQAGVNFTGWSATSDCMDYYGMQQRYFNWTLETDQVTFTLSSQTTQTPNSASSVGRTVRCVKE